MAKRIYFLSQTYSCINWAELLASQKQLIFPGSGKMYLITYIHTFNSPHQVQPEYQEKIYYQESPLVSYLYPPLHLKPRNPLLQQLRPAELLYC